MVVFPSKKVDSNDLLFLEEIANSIEFFHLILQHYKRKTISISFAGVRTHDLPHPRSKNWRLRPLGHHRPTNFKIRKADTFTTLNYVFTAIMLIVFSVDLVCKEELNHMLCFKRISLHREQVTSAKVVENSSVQLCFFSTLLRNCFLCEDRWNGDVMPTLDVALLCSSRVGSDLGRVSGLVWGGLYL